MRGQVTTSRFCHCGHVGADGSKVRAAQYLGESILKNHRSLLGAGY